MVDKITIGNSVWYIYEDFPGGAIGAIGANFSL